MGGREARDYWEDRGLALLWTSVLLGPTALLVGELLGYALVKPACAGGNRLLPIAVWLAALAVALAGAWIGWSCFLMLRGRASLDGGRIVDRSYFMALVAIGLNALASLVILMATTGPLILRPCE